jgi:hypothetical protein
VATIEGVGHRRDFIDRVTRKHPKPKGKAPEWPISGGHQVGAPTAPKASATPGPRVTPTTDARKNVIPRRFKLVLPDGKVNNIFDELKKLDVEKFKNAASVLLRVFIEFSAESFLKRQGVTLPQGKDFLIHKLTKITEIMKSNGTMTEKELKAIYTTINKQHSIASTNTLNAYVHNRDFNPDPGDLKRTWDNLQAFIENMWA